MRFQKRRAKSNVDSEVRYGMKSEQVKCFKWDASLFSLTVKTRASCDNHSLSLPVELSCNQSQSVFSQLVDLSCSQSQSISFSRSQSVSHQLITNLTMTRTFRVCFSATSMQIMVNQDILNWLQEDYCYLNPSRKIHFSQTVAISLHANILLTYIYLFFCTE